MGTLESIFSKKKPIIGMIHLAGSTDSEKILRALKEVEIYEKQGIDGAIVENFHSNEKDVLIVLQEIAKQKSHKQLANLSVGVNILPNEFQRSFEIANTYELDFIQLDFIAGEYHLREKLDTKHYDFFRKQYPQIVVLGGVWPKYYHPIKGSNLENDLNEGIQRADAIVVTGEGTGIETPIEKIIKFKEILGDYPLIIGAGLNNQNVFRQLKIADGAIVGSFFKKFNQTDGELEETKIERFMEQVNMLRER
ncbi:tryptophan synthase subunit alpha [Candidatus Pacearchaeota archaeon]|nr:tryptophan synthase subunit alpha [Candidatus Pacearchaeota archaeon]